MPRFVSVAIALVIAVAVLPSCGDPPSVPPSITELTFQPDTGVVNQPLTIEGSVVYYDPDGDIVQHAAEVRGPQSLGASIPATQAQGVSGSVDGRFFFQLLFTPPVAGRWEFDIWMIDADGNESNRLTGFIDVS